MEFLLSQDLIALNVFIKKEVYDSDDYMLFWLTS